MTHQLQRVSASLAFALVLLGFLTAHAVPALLAGLFMYLVTQGLKDLLVRYAPARVHNNHFAAVLAAFVSVSALGAIIFVGKHYMGGDAVGPLMLTAADTLQNLKHYLPADISTAIPDRVQDLKNLVVGALKEHGKELAGAGTGMLHGIFQVIIGWLIGIFIATNPMQVKEGSPAFARVWLDLWSRLVNAFTAVVRAQAKIAMYNAILAGVFLLLVMPLAGWALPFGKTMVLVTFICGLIPVVGNLISNTLLCAVALTVSFHAAVAVLLFMIVAHKLEYFLAARIQGHSMGACIWELLIALFVMEFVFGPAGMVIAPVLYSFGKHLLMDYDWLDRPEGHAAQ